MKLIKADRCGHQLGVVNNNYTLTAIKNTSQHFTQFKEVAVS